MRKLIYTVVICTVFLTCEHSTAMAQINLGIRGSLTIANFNGTNVGEIDPGTGYMVGAYAKITFPGIPFAIQPEILYTKKGFEISDGIEEENTNVNLNLEYIEIPLLAKINLMRFGKVSPHIYGGTYIALKINSDAKTNDAKIEVESINDTDYGLTLGAGVDIGRLNIGGRYEGSLAAITEKEGSWERNGIITLTAGIEF